jgi:heme exporter protein D
MMAKFLEMGGYAVYVWPAFAVAALVMIGLLITSLRTLRAREAILRRLEAAERRADDGA